MSSSAALRSKIAKRLLGSGYQVTPEALERLTELGEDVAEELVRWLASRAGRVSLVDARTLEAFLVERSGQEEVEEPGPAEEKTTWEEVELKILKPTYEEIRMEGKV